MKEKYSGIGVRVAIAGHMHLPKRWQGIMRSGYWIAKLPEKCGSSNYEYIQNIAPFPRFMVQFEKKVFSYK